MSAFERIRQLFRTLVETGIRAFTPTNDDYPESGVQPFDGEPYDDHQRRD